MVQLSWLHWHPEVIVFLVMIQSLYLVAIEQLRKQFGWATHFDRRKSLFFSAGLLVIALAEGTVLHELSEHYLFSAHMAQHLFIMLAAAPLLLLGTPPWLLRPVTTLRYMRPLVSFLTNPIAVGLLFNAVLIALHIPTIYGLALRVHIMHIVQHAFFLSISLLFWWPMLSPLPEHPRMSYAGQMLYLFAVKFPQVPLGAFLTFAPNAWYPTYIAAPRIWEYITPAIDQQIGGLIMSVLMGLVLFGAMAAIFFVWFFRGEKEEIGPRSRHAEN